MRRVAWALIIYAVAAWVAVTLAGWLERVLILPRSFDRLGLALLVMGLPVAIAVAWRFPHVGSGSEATRDDE